MRPVGHIITSTFYSIGVLGLTKSFLYFWISILVGVLVDIDHIFDFFLQRRKIILNKKELYKSFEDEPLKKAYIFFHSIEFLPVFWILISYFSTKQLATIIVLSMVQHIIVDIFTNPTRPTTYLFIYRFIKKFELRRLFKYPIER